MGNEASADGVIFRRAAKVVILVQSRQPSGGVLPNFQLAVLIQFGPRGLFHEEPVAPASRIDHRPIAMGRAQRSAGEHSAEGLLARIKVPTLVIAGSSSRPGASPTNITFACGLPSANTSWVAVAFSAQPSNLSRMARSSSSDLAALAAARAAMAASSVTVVSNALRLRRFQAPRFGAAPTAPGILPLQVEG